jgi:hypothetical protein
MRQRGAGYAPLPRETITWTFELIDSIARAKLRQWTSDSHLEGQRWAHQTLHHCLLCLNQLRRRPQHRRRRKFHNNPSRKAKGRTGAHRGVRVILSHSAPRHTTYPRTTYLHSREAINGEKPVRDLPYNTLWPDFVVLMHLKILPTLVPTLLLVKTPHSLKMATLRPVEMARQLLQKYHQVKHPKLLSQMRLNRWSLIMRQSLSYRPSQKPLSMTRGGQTRPQKLLERQGHLLYPKNNHPADQGHHPVAPARPKLHYVKPNRGHLAGSSKRVGPRLDPATRPRKIKKSWRTDSRETQHLRSTRQDMEM